MISVQLPRAVKSPKKGAAMNHEHHAIDVHAHYFPQPFLDLIAKHGPAHGFEYQMIEGKGAQFKYGHLMTGPVGPKFVDLDARLSAMDEQGVEVHAMSLSQPMVYWADGDLARRLAETYNDALARAHERLPKRLIGLATLPMHEGALAVKEIERAAKLPGIRGFYIATQIRAKDLSDAAYLIFGGVLDRFPELTVCLPHSGGAFPWLVGRLNRGWEKRADLKHIKQPPIEYLRRFYYDTVGYSDPVLEYLVKVIGADRVLMGSDYCFPIAYERPVEIVTAHRAPDDGQKRKIVEDNARRLLKI